MLLMDEPFGALDALTRGAIQDELMNIWRETQQTVFMITHDVDEAILLADRVLLMTNGPRASIAESVETSRGPAAEPQDDAARARLLRDPQPPGRFPGQPLASSINPRAGSVPSKNAAWSAPAMATAPCRRPHRPRRVTAATI